MLSHLQELRMLCKLEHNTSIFHDKGPFYIVYNVLLLLILIDIVGVYMRSYIATCV